MHARTTVCYQKALQSKVKLGLKTMLLIIDSYLLLYNAREHLNDLETEEKSTGNVNIFADAKTHHLLNCKMHDSFKALSPWNPQSSSLKIPAQAADTLSNPQYLYGHIVSSSNSLDTNVFYKMCLSGVLSWCCHCLLTDVFQHSAFGFSSSWSSLWSWLRSAQEHLVI